MRHVWLALLLAAACGDDMPGGPATLVSGAATLDLSADSQTLTFSRDGSVLLTFEASAFAVGTVDDLDAGDSFDPYWLFVASPSEPAGLAWHRAARFGVVRATADELVLAAGSARLAFAPEGTDGFSATMTSSA
ncbi:MAG: hypothetical protein ACM31C_31595, partial [Acidobacteriota bacterium]